MSRHVIGNNKSYLRESINRKPRKLIKESKSLKDSDLEGHTWSFKLAKKKNEHGEFIVKCYRDGKYYEAGTYYTDDWEDAVDSIKYLAKTMGLTVKEMGNNRYIAESKMIKEDNSQTAQNYHEPWMDSGNMFLILGYLDSEFPHNLRKFIFEDVISGDDAKELLSDLGDFMSSYGNALFGDLDDGASWEDWESDFWSIFENNTTYVNMLDKWTYSRIREVAPDLDVQELNNQADDIDLNNYTEIIDSCNK